MRRAWLLAPAMMWASASAGQDASARTVEVILVGGGADTGALIDTVRELLARLKLTANVHAVSSLEDAERLGRGSAEARVQIDLRASGETTVNASGKDGISRARVLRRDPSPSIAREELAHAVQALVEVELGLAPSPEPMDASIENVSARRDVALAPEASVPPSEPAPVFSPPVLTRPERPPIAIDLTAHAGGTAFASNAGPAARFGGAIALVWRRGASPSVAFEAQYVMPFEARGTQVIAQASSIGLRWTGGVELARVGFFGLSARVGGGVDVLVVEPRSPTLGLSALASASTRTSPVLSAILAADFAVAAPLVVTLRFLADVDAGESRQYLDVIKNESVFAPWRFRPSLLLGLTFTPVGPGPLPSRKPTLARGGPP